jgi:hypothetical protein
MRKMSVPIGERWRELFYIAMRQVSLTGRDFAGRRI